MRYSWAMVLIILYAACGTQHSITITEITCENKVEPLGVPLKGISFSWKMASGIRGQYQTSYHLVIASSENKLRRGDYDIWNTGKTESRNNLLVTYDGQPLVPASEYFWKVKVWDKNGNESAWSETGRFVTGLFSEEDWHGASWIGYEELPDSLLLVPGVHGFGNNLGHVAIRRPVIPLFRKDFNVDKKVESAILYISGLGHYEARINGEKIHESFLAPGWTHYHKTVLYNSYDVTLKVRDGKNTLGAIVGNGFHNVNRERYRKLVIAFGMPRLICHLRIRYTDGTEKTVVSGRDWKTAPSPIIYSSIYGGEDYDARLEQHGWDTPGFDENGWKNALLAEPPSGLLKPESDFPVQILESFIPVNIRRLGDSSFLYDFGQNASGIIEIRVKGKKGQQIRMTPSELIHKDGTANQRSSGSPHYYEYILKGEGTETWRPAFTYYGFRYLQVEGASHETFSGSSDLPVIEDATMLHIRNSAPVTGNFSCSDELFSSTFDLINWAIKSNLVSVLTDCPHREKLGWLEVTHLMGSSIHYNYNIHNFYRKMIYDMMDSQLQNGLVPSITPEYVEFIGGFRDSPEWGSASVILPWLLNKWYGDKTIIEESWPMIHRYIDYLGTTADNHIISHGLGDWYDLGPDRPGRSQLTPIALTATAIYYHTVVISSEMAELIGMTEKAKELTLVGDEIRQAFNDRFYDSETKVYSTGSQTAMAMPLYLGLVHEDDREAVLANLIRSIESSGKALTAGDVGFFYLIRALTEGDASQLIFEMNNRTDVPGYGYQLKRGATSLTESWAALETSSHNHLMLGHIMDWFYGGLAGIRQTGNSTAYRNILIEPHFIGEIQWVNADFETPHGTVISSWKREGDEIYLHVRIPVNTVANIIISVTSPDRVTESGIPVRQSEHIEIAGSFDGKLGLVIGSGDYRFRFEN